MDEADQTGFLEGKSRFPTVTFDFSLPFVLQTDASDRGLGAVLSQVVEGEDRPILYISRKLSVRETKYSTIERVYGHEVGSPHPPILPAEMPFYPYALVPIMPCTSGSTT